jgi:hypothetical protein
MFDDEAASETLKPGTHVEVLTKKQVDGKSLCGTILTSSPDVPGAYIVEYHPGLDNGTHPQSELRILSESLCPHSTPRPF